MNGQQETEEILRRLNIAISELHAVAVWIRSDAETDEQKQGGDDQ